MFRYTVRSLLALALSFPLCSPASAGADHRQYGPWRSARIGGGGYIQDVVATSVPDRYYSYVDVGGAYRSDDGGRTWHQMLYGNLPTRGGIYSVRGLSVDPRNPDHLVVATGTRWAPVVGILRSEDAGRTWQMVQEAVFFGNDGFRTAGRILMHQPRTPDTLLAAAAGAIFRSTDAGRSWTQVGPEGLLAHGLTFDRRNPDHVWLCATAAQRPVAGRGQQQYEGGLFHSQDGGITWTKRADEAPLLIVQDPVELERIYGLFDRRVVRVSTDDGRTWRDLMDGLPLAPTGGRNTTSRALAAGPDRILLATGEGEFFQLLAGDQRWQAVPREGITADDWWYGNYGQREGWIHFGKEVTGITVNPHNPDQWFFSDWYAIWRSDDRGRNWHLSVDGIEVTVVHTLRQSPNDPRLVHLGMADNGYLRSTDGGNTWRQVRGEGAPNNVKDIDLAPVDPARLYATGPATHGWHANQVYRSDDAGRTWRSVSNRGLPEDLADRQSNSVSVHPQRSDELIIGVSGHVAEGAGGVYRSVDGGANWQWLGEGLPSDGGFFRTAIWNGGRELAISGDGTMACYSDSRRRVYHYDPEVRQWRRASIDLAGRPFSLAADPHRPGRFYLGAAGDGLHRSDDGGRSWQRLFEGDVFHVRPDDVQPDRLVFGTSQGVYLSPDGGQTAHHLGHELPYKERPFPTFAGEHVVVGTTGTGVFWRPLHDTAEQAP